ncbi:MAG: DUF4190 domain-containing protein [Planctomycetes bacterium]|nr:DUF4190 domain-containing protein [Planctomycetota bacterium]NUQ34157.1 DUF4190 domain-containing protein [Planctomycetaceae bacterium]
MSGYQRAPMPAGGQPYGNEPGEHKTGNGFAVTGLVLGILGLVLCWTTWPGAILGILGIIFGAVGLSAAKKRNGAGKGMAMTGLILGILGTLLAIIWMAFIVSMITNSSSEFRKEFDKAMREQQQNQQNQPSPAE